MTTSRDRGASGAGVDWVRLAPLLVCAAGLLAYANSFAGVFVYDDIPRLVENPALRRLVPPWSFPATTGRPVTDYTFALNYAAGGLDPPVVFHVTNLAIHLLAALTLYGILRRTFLLAGGACGRARAAAGLAAAAASLWVCHPLTTAAVTYVVQRYASLMGLCYLLTLYTFLRGATAAGGRVAWYALSVLSCALGMGCKETMVTAPVAVLCYDAVFLSRDGGWVSALRKRWGVYLGLALAWLPLAWFMQAKLAADTTRFYAWSGVKPWVYAWTQVGAVGRYLWVSVRPAASCFDYVWPDQVPPLPMAGAAVGLALLAAVTLAGLWRRAGWSYLGAWFFLILAPTSSVVPRPDPYVEHRFYLPLMAVVTALVLGVRQALVRLAARRAGGRPGAWGGVLLAAGLVFFSALTRQRNALFASPLALWEHVTTVCPWNGRAGINLMTALLNAGAYERVIVVGTELVARCEDLAALAPEDVPLHPRNPPEARRALRARHYAHAHNALGVAHAALGRPHEAVRHFGEACRLLPFWEDACNNLRHAQQVIAAGDRAGP